MCCPCSSCYPSTDTKTRSKCSPFFYSLKLFIYYSFSLIFYSSSSVCIQSSFLRNEEATRRKLVCQILYVDNLRMIYGDSVEIHKVHKYEQKCNMDTHKPGVVEFLDNYEVTRGNKDVVACLDKNDSDNFNVDFLHAQTLEQIIEETFGGKCLVYHGYMQKINNY